MRYGLTERKLEAITLWLRFHNKFMAGKTRSTLSETGSAEDSTNNSIPGIKGTLGNHKLIMSALLVVGFFTFITIMVDLYKDRSTNDRLVDFMIDSLKNKEEMDTENLKLERRVDCLINNPSWQKQLCK